MKKLLLVSLCFLMLSLTQAFAQNRTITGTVTAKDDGLPIPGVTVKIKGTDVGVPTDASGKYSISAPAGATLSFSFVAFVTQDVVVGDRSTVNVTMSPNNQQLSEVVVTALGIQREAKSLGYSTSTVKSEDLTRARQTNVINSLAGQMAGVRINNSSGTVGGSSKITIRGVNSFGGNNTLYVIDGLTITESTANNGGTAVNNVDYGNRVGDLSSDDIESITVLKGAAAAALYGNRARDGAVIITTKRGKAGKAAIEVNSSYTFSNPLVLPKFQNEYAQGNQGVYALTQVNGWGPKIADVQNQTFTNFLGQQVTLQAYPNNVKDYFQTGKNAVNNVAVSGGDDKSDYRFSFSSTNSTGIIPQSTLDRYTLSVNAGRKFSDKLSGRFTGSYTSIAADGRPAQASNNTNGLVGTIFGLPRTVDINLLKNNFEDPTTGAQITLSPNRNANNPFWIMKYNRNSNTVDRFVSTYNLTYTPVSWITLSNTFGADIYTEKRFERIRKGTSGFLNGQFTNFDGFNQQINNDFLATFDQNNLVKDFKFKLILGGNINQRFLQTNNVFATNLTIDQLYNYTNAESKTPTLGYSKQRLIGAFGDFGISYKDMVYLNVTGRNDWTSTLPVANRSFFYPSVSGSFVFSELLKQFSWLSSGKVRASWASVGSDTTPYQLDFQYTPLSTVFLQYVSSTATVFPAGPISTAFAGPNTLPNAFLVPQKVNSFELGTDLSFFNDRIGLVVNYYNSTISKQLIPITIPASTGYRAKFVNIGAIQNSGVELELNTVPVKLNNGFRWDLGFNFATNKQTIKELAPGLTQYTVASGYSGLSIRGEVGQSLGIYGLGWTRSPDGQYVINPTTGLKVATTTKRLGSIMPDWTGGIKNTFSYKGLSLFALVDIRKGGVFFTGTLANLKGSGLLAETGGDRSALIVDQGVNLVNGAYVPNTKGVTKQNFYVWEGNVSNTEANTFDAGFIKLRQVQLAYRLPASLFKAGAIKGVQVGIEGNNLWLIKSHVPGIDPEQNFFGSGSVGEGVEFNSIPTSRSIGMNVRLSF